MTYVSSLWTPWALADLEWASSNLHAPVTAHTGTDQEGLYTLALQRGGSRVGMGMEGRILALGPIQHPPQGQEQARLRLTLSQNTSLGFSTVSWTSQATFF